MPLYMSFIDFEKVFLIVSKYGQQQIHCRYAAWTYYNDASITVNLFSGTIPIKVARGVRQENHFSAINRNRRKKNRNNNRICIFRSETHISGTKANFRNKEKNPACMGSIR